MKPGKWLKRRGQRRVDAVDFTYGVLGLDYGKGHLDNLYLAAYKHGLLDAWAFTAEDALDGLGRARGYMDLDMAAQHTAALEKGDR